jgi:hypothetical protein
MTIAHRADASGTYGALQVAGTDVLRYGSDSSGQLAGFRNKIINGGFDIVQRAISAALTTSPAYQTVDRFSFLQLTTAAGSSAQVSGSGSGQRYALKIGRTAAATATGSIITQYAAETSDSILLAGSPVTFSFMAKVGANYSGGPLAINVYTGTGTDQSLATLSAWTGNAAPVSTTQSLTTSWAKYYFTGTFGASVSQFGFDMRWTPTGTAGADDNLYITAIQMEKGSIATPFENRPIGVELALCKRYYQWIPFNVNFYATNASQAAEFPTSWAEMRTAPTASGVAPDPWVTQVSNNNNSNTVVRLSPTGGSYNVVAAGGSSATYVVGYRVALTAEL